MVLPAFLAPFASCPWGLHHLLNRVLLHADADGQGSAGNDADLLALVLQPGAGLLERLLSAIETIVELGIVQARVARELTDQQAYAVTSNRNEGTP